MAATSSHEKQGPIFVTEVGSLCKRLVRVRVKDCRRAESRERPREQGEPVITGRYRVGDVRHIFATPKRLVAELGWRPAVDFATGTAEFATAPMRGLDVTVPA